MAEKGWVAIYRKLQDHWLWQDKPFSKQAAWVDMLLLANHDDNKVLLGNELVKVKCGSFITSEVKLMERWGWSKRKTRTFLDLLQNDGMIVKISNRKRTTINIVKYEDYAVLRTANEPQTDCDRTANEPQADTNNNDNNDNNIYKKESSQKTPAKKPSYDDILLQVTDDSLRDLYLEYIKMRKMIKSPMTDRALTMLIKKVGELEPSNVEHQKKLLEAAIMNNWKSVYPLKEDKVSNTKTQSHAAYDIDAFEKMLNEKN